MLLLLKRPGRIFKKFEKKGKKKRKNNNKDKAQKPWKRVNEGKEGKCTDLEANTHIL